MAGTSPVDQLSLLFTTAPSLPVSEQVGSTLDLVAYPWLAAQAAMDSLRSIATSSQPSTLVLMAEGQLSTVAPIATITYASATAPISVTIGGVAVPGVSAVGANDTATAALVAAAINASLNHNQYVVASSSGAVVSIQGLLPGTGLNTVALAATATTGTATVSAATLGGSSAGGARAGVAWTQLNKYGIGTPL